MGWMTDLPDEVRVAGLPFMMAGECLIDSGSGLNAYGLRTDRPESDWAASACLALARAQLDQLILLLDSAPLNIPARLMSGEAVSERLLAGPLNLDQFDDWDECEDNPSPAFWYEHRAHCVGEAVELWRALAPDQWLSVGHGFEFDGSITITTGPFIPECPALGIKGCDGELLTSPRYIQEQVVGVMRDVAALVREVLKAGAVERADEPERLLTVDSKDRTSTSPEPVADGHGVTPGAIAQLPTNVVQQMAAEAHVWAYGFEDELITYLAGLLGHSQLLRCDTPESTALAKARVACLCMLHFEFCARSGEGEPGEWTHQAHFLRHHFSIEEQHLLGGLFDLGFFTDDDDAHEDEDGGWVWLSDNFVRDVVLSVHDDVVGALKKELQNWVLPYFWAARLDEVEFPLDGELVGELVNEDVEQKLEAYQWVEDGMKLPWF